MCICWTVNNGMNSPLLPLVECDEWTMFRDLQYGEYGLQAAIGLHVSHQHTFLLKDPMHRWINHKMSNVLFRVLTSINRHTIFILLGELLSVILLTYSFWRMHLTIQFIHQGWTFRVCSCFWRLLCRSRNLCGICIIVQI